MQQNIQIDPQRLWDAIMETAEFGKTPKGGVKRLTLTDLDKQVRDWFRRQCEAVGCTVTVDEVGNMFARRPGRDNSLPPICVGSHLDTQPTGGKFDGILGVLSGLELLRTLHDTGYETNAPIEVINWTNEEGSRFAPAMLASGVFAGVFTKEYAYSREDREGQHFGDELERIGYKGPEPVGQRKLGAHFELHIEQGPILEAEEKVIGVVTGVQGMRWYEVTVTGRESHAGSTPMRLRRDALRGAARMIEAVIAVGDATADAVATVGLVEVRPNSRNVIPGEVFFTIDYRHPDDAKIGVMEKEARAAIDRIAAELKLEVKVEAIWDSPAVKFDPGCIDAVENAARANGFTHRRIVSGPGHDSAYIARVAPTAMIFVPCREGISHNEEESIESDHAAAGANVLLRAVLDYDRSLEQAGKAA
ncbi:Zn-dependent hydrolase [Inquilinus limosus]|uniref:Zn-dependent hydrolase n=1 Tax=Inquilinus limosus TaxID=171674 RepID=UPI003F147C15